MRSSPGTGKTVTLVEAMEQILTANPNSRILACAPSNSAADLLAQKLMRLGSSVVFRLNSIVRNVEDLPKTLKPFCLINENTVFAVPQAEELAKYRVVVSTCLSGGVPASLGLKRGHYTHIFIDEAGQGKEPEAMVPIKSIAGKDTNVILAGDNQQLGPIVHSATARMLGLTQSYLARLMNLPIYDIEGENTGPGGRGITFVFCALFHRHSEANKCVDVVSSNLSRISVHTHLYFTSRMSSSTGLSCNLVETPQWFAVSKTRMTCREKVSQSSSMV